MSYDASNPFAEPEVVSAKGKKVRWDVPEKERLRYQELFHTMPSSVDGAATGADCRGIMVKSGLPTDVLKDIWALSDIEKDGKLDLTIEPETRRIGSKKPPLLTAD